MMSSRYSRIALAALHHLSDAPTKGVAFLARLALASLFQRDPEGVWMQCRAVHVDAAPAAGDVVIGRFAGT
jgi:hypothetical protein